VSGPTSPPDEVLASLLFFYCGRGDTILVEARGGGWGLIDCNLTHPSGARQRVRRLIQDPERGIGTLRFVCLTHPDRDHYHGMRDLLAECFCDHTRQGLRPRFREFWDSGVDFRVIEALASRMRKKGAGEELTSLYDFLCPLFARDAVERVALNELTIPLEEFGEFFFVALAPRRNRVDQFSGRKFREILQSTEERLQGPREQSNNLSVVLVLMHRAEPLNILFGGDATAAVWKEALESWDRLLTLSRFADRARHFSGVKVSHHGARGSLHPDLYRDYCLGENTLAILSVGPHDDGHPDREVLRVLREYGIRAYATCWPTEGRAEVDGTLPLPGDLVGEDSGGYPPLAGYACADVHVMVFADGRLEASPPESLLRLS
jgi:beta-lactamase superfamily II metal-dependent hydrolase